MNKKLLPAVLSLLFAQAGWAQDNPCASASETTDQKIAEIRGRYDKIVAEQRERTVAKSQKIKDDTPDATGPDASLKLDIQLRDNLREFKMDLPEVTMKTQKMSMDLPEITMKTQSWSWDVPELVMETVCRAGPDELVLVNKTCHNDIPPFDYPCPEMRTRRGPDICFDEPRNRMRHEEIKFDVPEVKMGRTEWSIDVPEVAMKTETIKVNIPDIIVKNIEVAAAKQKDDINALSNEARSASANISTAMTREMEAVNKASLAQTFACQRQDMQKRMREAYDKIRTTEKVITVSYNQAREVKATELASSYEKALATLKESKTKMLKSYVENRRAMAKKEKDAVNSIKVSSPPS